MVQNIARFNFLTKLFEMSIGCVELHVESDCLGEAICCVYLLSQSVYAMEDTTAGYHTSNNSKDKQATPTWGIHVTIPNSGKTVELLIPQEKELVVYWDILLLGILWMIQYSV